MTTHHSACSKHLAAAALGVLCLTAAAPACAEANSPQVNMFDGQWHFSLTPYLWLPTIYTSASFAGPLGIAPGVDADMHTTPGTYLHNLSFAFFLGGEARKGEWSLFTDYMYLKFKDQNASVRTVTGPAGLVTRVVDRGSTMDLKSNVWTLAGGYTAWRRGNSHLDILVGTRYLSMDTSLDWSVDGAAGLLPGRQRSLSSHVDKWDAIVGLKGQLNLSDDGKWFMPYYLDVGTGSRNTTWQALLGAGYRYGWGDVTLVLRNLSYDFSGHHDDNIDARFTGLGLGATFVF